MKKHLILAAIIIVLVVAVVLVMKFYPVWVTLQNVIVLVIGLVLGWIARCMWCKYFQK